MGLCEEGTTIDGPACKNKAKVIRSGPPVRGKKKIKFVDDHAEACIFITKLESKETSDSGYEYEQ